jgi:hypothetical protein
MTIFLERRVIDTTPTNNGVASLGRIDGHLKVYQGASNEPFPASLPSGEIYKEGIGIGARTPQMHLNLSSASEKNQAIFTGYQRCRLKTEKYAEGIQGRGLKGSSSAAV